MIFLPSATHARSCAWSPRWGRLGRKRPEKPSKNARPAYKETYCTSLGLGAIPERAMYAVYGCVWDEPNLNGLFGATPNLYAQNRFYELYYYGLQRLRPGRLADVRLGTGSERRTSSAYGL